MRFAIARAEPTLEVRHHTRFGPSACARGSLYGAVFRRFFARYHQTFALQQLADGARRRPLPSGWSRSSTRFNLRGPQRMCAWRSSRTCCSISPRSGSHAAPPPASVPPAQPLRLPYRRNQTLPSFPRYPKLWQSSVMVCSSRSYSKTNRSFSSHHTARFPWHALRCTRAGHRCQCQECARLFCQDAPGLYHPLPSPPPVF